MKKIICILLCLTCVFAFSACSVNSPNYENTFPDITENSTTQSSVTETTTEFEDPNPIGKETLQYPSQNDVFTYDVYESYVEITGSVKEDLTGELIIPEMLENLPVRSVGDTAFGGPGEGFTTPGYSISSLILPDNLYQISNSAFYKCENLKSITFGKELTTIGSMAFAHTDITSVEIPDKVTETGSSIFLCCENLEKVTIGKSMTNIPDSMFQACSKLSSIEWNGNIGIIGADAFSGTAFETISLPDTVTTIEGGAFANMENLKEFTFPDSVIEISGWVLEDCINLQKVTIGKGISALPEYLFSGSPSISELIIPSNVTDIHSNIFGEGGFDSHSSPTIYGEKASEAANFASSKGLTFKIIEN